MNTNQKGNLALVKVIASLVENGYEVFTPLSEHSKVDLIAYKDNKCIRLQVKYNTDGLVRNKTLSMTRNGIKTSTYTIDDFDYYAVYNGNNVIYLPFELGGRYIRYDLPNQEHEFYWYEDFLTIKSDIPKKRKTSEFKIPVYKTRPHKRKFEITKDELQTLLWQLPTTKIASMFGVTDQAVARRAKKLNCTKPSRGYWSKNKAIIV